MSPGTATRPIPGASTATHGTGTTASPLPTGAPAPRGVQARVVVYRPDDPNPSRGAGAILDPAHPAHLAAELTWPGDPWSPPPERLFATWSLEGRTGDLVLARSGGVQGRPVYAAAFPVAEVIPAAPGQSAARPGYAIFRTTPSQDTVTMRRQLAATRREGVPQREIQFHDDTSPPQGPRLPGAAMLEGGGAQRVEILVRLPTGETVGTGSAALPGKAAWMYWSGHYPYTSGGLLSGSPVDPWSIRGEGWKSHLKTLVFAACYAVDINAPDGETLLHGRGVHGALWWKKFEGTLLGYRGSAPSDPEDSRVVEKFMARVRASRVSPSDDAAWSRELAECWMKANTHDMGASGAAALDSSGRYYYLRTRDVHLRGVPFRHDVRYATAERSRWEADNQRLVEDFEVEKQVFGPVRAIMWDDFGGRPPTASQVLQSPRWAAAARAVGKDPRDPGLLRKLQGFLDYEAHIFYDVPRPDYYQAAIAWLARRKGGQLPTVAEVEAHFTPTGSRPQARRMPRQQIEDLLFFQAAWQVATAWVWDGSRGAWRLPSSTEVRSQLAARYPMTPEREQALQGIERYLSAYRS